MGFADREMRQRAAADERRERREAAKQTQGARRQLAEKIVMIAVDRITAEIIRPGPVSEERECYDMARELREFSADLIETVIDQLNINEGCE